MMEYGTDLEENIPPPLDDVSSGAGSDYGEDDLEVNVYSSHLDESEVSPPKHYKSFQPVIKLQPTDLIYREENSRAAPRKGIDPKAFLSIGDTKEEKVEYVGRYKHTGTAPNHSHGEKKNLANSAKRYSQRQPSVSAPIGGNRNKSAISRNTSGRGRRSGILSTPGYTPLPIAPPVAPPTRENTYVSRPFKQDLAHDIERFEANISSIHEHRLNTMEEFLASLAFQSIPSRCQTAYESKALSTKSGSITDSTPAEEVEFIWRRPVSPGAEMKQSTLFATMEVGRYINQREKTPKFARPHEPRLLKARLKPLNTVAVDGPSIYQCQGVQPDKRTFGPSPMKTKQQQQLDNMIKKNAAIKDLPVSTKGSRKGSSKQEERKQTAVSAKSVRIKSSQSRTSTKLRTPSPITSMTQITRPDTADNEEDELKVLSKEKTTSRPESAAPSEASQTSQQAIARSVSAVTIRHRESATPGAQSNHRESATPGAQSNRSMPASGRQSSVVESSGNNKGLTFITDADSVANASIKQTIIEKEKQKSGCKDFAETSGPNTEHDDDDNDKQKDYNVPSQLTHTGTTGQINAVPTSNSNNQQASDPRQSSDQQGNQAGNQNNQTINWHPVPGSKPPKPFRPTRSLSAKDRMRKEHQEQLENHSTFITAGFLTLESMISDARSMLRRSYSFNDLDKSCDWTETINSSPRSIEVLTKGVTFAKEEERFYYDTDHVETTTNKDNDMQLVLYDNHTDIADTKLDLLETAEVDHVSVEAHPRDKLKKSKSRKTKEPVTSQRPRSCMDNIQRELASRQSKFDVHGEMSEYLTTRPTVRQIYPPVSKKSTSPSAKVDNAIDMRLDYFSDSPYSSPDLPTEFDTSNPPPTPFSFDDEGFESISGSQTPEQSEAGDRCFLETLVELMPEEEKVVKSNQNQECYDIRPPGAVEGQTKKVNVRETAGVVEPIASLAPACFRITALPPQGCVFYFAYDADMNKERFSTLLGRKLEEKRWGLLMGFQLVFNKQGIDPEAGLFPNIEANPYSSTEGAVYTISYDELAAVDGYHGYPSHYARIIVPTWVCNSAVPDEYNIAQYCVPTVTYVAQDEWLHREYDTPTSGTKEYNLRQCVKGSDGLTDGYKGHLNSMLLECA